MCIRDRGLVSGEAILGANIFKDLFAGIRDIIGGRSAAYEACLLYTSDAADERSSVDLGGRRIIKKKNR